MDKTVLDQPAAFRWFWTALRSAARWVYYRLYRAQLRLRCWHEDRWKTDPASNLPPAMLRFRVSECLSAREFARIGQGCARIIAEKINLAGVEMAGVRRVLDFGCGCGRTTVWFLRDYPDVEFHGVDVDAEAIAWCQAHLPDGHFMATPTMPPLPYPNEYFDVIYCLSVFTHLDERMQDAWLAELRRLLAPGGLLVFTIHGANATAGLDRADLETLRGAGFLHKRSKKLRGIVPDWYHTTWHARFYITTRLAPWYRDISCTTDANHLQDFVTARPKS